MDIRTKLLEGSTTNFVMWPMTDVQLLEMIETINLVGTNTSVVRELPWVITTTIGIPMMISIVI